MGFILLAGGAEFGGRMAEADLQAIARAGGPSAPVRIIPTAAAPDANHVRAGQNGVRWFKHLGATDVEAVPLIDAKSAASPHIAQALRAGKLIYLLGGFPAYLGETLKGSAAWQAVLDAFERGAVVAGSSAGAMVLCPVFYDPQTGQPLEGLSLVRNGLVLPHHASFGKTWAAGLLKKLPGVPLLGIDEATGMLDDGSGENWSVFGSGAVTVYQQETRRVVKAGQTIKING